MKQAKVSKLKIKAAKIPEVACGLHCLQMNNICVRDGALTIIEDINLHIHCGKITVIIGKNGAGKSTLIKAILGEVKHEGSTRFT